jgi:glycosyltransferase involved in cell wall biosynthesis
VKVCFLAYEYDPIVRGDMGGYRKIWELAENVERLGHEVVVVAPRHGAPRTQTHVPVLEVPFIDRPAIRPAMVYAGLFARALLHGRRRTPDVVYVRTLHSPLPALLARLLRCALVVEVNGDALAQREAAGARAAALAYVRWSDRVNLRAAAHVIPITDGLGRMVRERHGVDAARVTVIGSAANTELFRPEPAAAARARVGLDPSARAVGFVGTFFAYQGVDALIDAAPSLLARCPDARVLLVGDGPLGERWRARVAASPHRAAFVLPGQVPYARVADWINAMDVCVAPWTADRGETSPLKVFDALACARPVVASAIPSVRPLIDADVGVVGVPPDDPRALVNGVAALLDDPARRTALGARGRAWVERDHSWAAVARHTVAVCARAAAISPRGGRA